MDHTLHSGITEATCDLVAYVEQEHHFRSAAQVFRADAAAAETPHERERLTRLEVQACEQAIAAQRMASYTRRRIAELDSEIQAEHGAMFKRLTDQMKAVSA